MEGVVSNRLESGEGRPGLEAVFRGKTRSRESPPVPTVQDVAVEMCVPVVRVVGVCCHPSFLFRFSPVCRTGDKERATLVLLLNYRPYVVHIQRHIVFQVCGPLGIWDAEPVCRQSSFVFIVPTPNNYGRMRLEALNLITK